MTRKQARNKWAAFAAEAVGGALLAAILGYGLGRLLAAVIPASQGGGMEDLVAGIGGLLVGVLIGAPLGVVLTGQRLMYHYGAWWAALIGAVLGIILAFALAPVLLAGLSDVFPFVVAITSGIVSAAAYGWSARRA